MISPNHDSAGNGPYTRIALESSDDTASDAASLIRSHSVWQSFGVEDGDSDDAWHIAVPGCSEHVLVHGVMSEQPGGSRYNICLYAAQFESITLICEYGPIHPIAPGLLLHLLGMVHHAIGGVTQRCMALIEDEGDEITSLQDFGAIVTYQKLAPLLATRTTVIDGSTSSLLWTDLRTL